MSQTKLATIRYEALDRRISNWGLRFNIEDLISACNESLREHLGEDAETKRRKLFYDIRKYDKIQGSQISESLFLFKKQSSISF